MLSKRFREYDRPTQTIMSLKMNGKEVADDDLITIALEEFHYMSMGEYLDVQPDEVEKNGTPMEVATKSANVLQEYFDHHDHLEIDGEKRLVIHE